MKEFKTILKKLEEAPQIPAVKLAKRSVLTAQALVDTASAELSALIKEEVPVEAPKSEAPAPIEPKEEAPKKEAEKEVKPSKNEDNESLKA